MEQYLTRRFIFRLSGFFLIVAVIMSSGCAYFANKPLKTLSYIDDDATSRKNLIVFVRGLGGSHRSFEEEGLVEATRQSGIAFDMMAPNAHFAYYAKRTLIERLRKDVILPAQKKGYDNIWLVGFSMGGLGSLLYVREHPEDISGICMISPFLGDDAIITEINKNGGLQGWTPGDYSPEDDWERMLWHWIKIEVATEQSIPIYLGFGNNDPYVKAQQLLSTALPENHTIRRKGAHDYETFKGLWRSFLDRNLWITD